MLNKRSCYLCHQKHEQPWDEESWIEGFISCPLELVPVYYRGRKVDFGSPEEHLLRVLESARQIDAAAPEWCEFTH